MIGCGVLWIGFKSLFTSGQVVREQDKDPDSPQVNSESRQEQIEYS